MKKVHPPAAHNMEEDRIAVDVAMVIQFAEGARSIKLYNDDRGSMAKRQSSGKRPRAFCHWWERALTQNTGKRE
jgi:hypothetical protein